MQEDKDINELQKIEGMSRDDLYRLFSEKSGKSVTCEKSFLIECSCEADRWQVLKDEEDAYYRGLIEIDGRVSFAA